MEWKDGKRQEGDEYVGEYKYNKRHGQGTYTFPDGKKFSGEWRYGEFVDGEHFKTLKEALKMTVSATNFQLAPIDLQKTTIEQMIWDDVQLKFPFEGGWGYSKDDALIINKNHANVTKGVPFYGVGFEYKFVRYRLYKELALNRNHYFVTESVKYNLKTQAVIRGEGGKVYDLLKFEICAEELFLNDKGEPSIQSDVLLCYDTEYWFEISSFFGK
ncbi:MORN repeat-containing protein [Nitrosomonadales bacterium]|nr:MORN repeat-containing protein [Nitrosomonadales bacterium]